MSVLLQKLTGLSGDQISRLLYLFDITDILENLQYFLC